MPIIPKVKNIPATGVQYRFKILRPDATIYATVTWSCGFIDAGQPPWPDGDNSADLDAYALTLADRLAAAENVTATGWTVATSKRWLYAGDSTDYDPVLLAVAK